MLIDACDKNEDNAFTVSAKRIGGPLLFGKLWERLGIASVLKEMLKDRAFEFAVERAVFAGTLHLLFVSGSDRDCVSWLEDYEIPGVEGLSLHHLPRHGLARRGAGGEASRCIGAALHQGRHRGKAVR
jgi:hypothetical protein